MVVVVRDNISPRLAHLSFGGGRPHLHSSIMPAQVAPGDLVLLTGASGYIAVHVLVQLLKRGFRVRGTVRSAAKGDYLTSVVKKEGCEKGWEYVIVEDIEKEGAFDEAIKGVDAVEHTASPFHFRVTDPFADLINPAVQGTLGLLRSAAKEPKVKRVVITSSFAAVVEPHEPVYEYSEKDWNETSPRMVEEKGKETDPFHAYRASKTLAERAAWDFVDKEKPGFDLATINPPFVIGPLLHEVPSADKLNTSVAMFYGFLTGDKKAEDAQGGSGSMTDVRDVAHCHIEALVRPDASMKRFCVATQSFTWQMCLDAVHATKDDDLVSKTFPNAVVGNTGAPEPKQNKISTAQARKVFEWQPIPLEKTAVDMAKSLAEYKQTWS